MMIIPIIFYYTWFIWPFVFVFGLAVGICLVVKGELAGVKWLVAASVALLFIIAGLMYPDYFA